MNFKRHQQDGNSRGDIPDDYNPFAELERIFSSVSEKPTLLNYDYSELEKAQIAQRVVSDVAGYLAEYLGELPVSDVWTADSLRRLMNGKLETSNVQLAISGIEDCKLVENESWDPNVRLLFRGIVWRMAQELGNKRITNNDLSAFVELELDDLQNFDEEIAEEAWEARLSNLRAAAELTLFLETRILDASKSKVTRTQSLDYTCALEIFLALDELCSEYGQHTTVIEWCFGN